MPRPFRHYGSFFAFVALSTPLCFALLLAASLTSCGKPAESATPQAAPVGIPVTVARVTAQDLPRSVHIVGSLAAMEQVTLSNRVTGVVTKIHVDLGQQVKPGQPLAEIDPQRFDLARDQAGQAMDETLSRLGLTEIPTGAFDVDATTMVKKAQSELQAEQIKFDRASALYQKQLIKDFEYFDQRASLEIAQTGLSTARDEARAMLAVARQKKTLMDILNKDCIDAVIKTPDGTTPNGNVTIAAYTVKERLVSEGEYVREGTAMFTLVADGALKLQARVPERYLADIKRGQILNFHVEAFGPESFPATITALDPAIDASSRSFILEARVDNTDGRLKPGLFVQGEIATRQDKGVLTVPVDAIASFAGVDKIYVLDRPAPGNADEAGHVRAIEVTIGQQVASPAGSSIQNWVEVSPAATTNTPAATALHDGDQVATSGLSKLNDQTPVQIREESASAAPPASVPSAGPGN